MIVRILRAAAVVAVVASMAQTATAQCTGCTSSWGNSTWNGVENPCAVFTLVDNGKRNGECLLPACQVADKNCLFSFNVTVIPTGNPGCAVWFVPTVCLGDVCFPPGLPVPLPGPFNSNVVNYPLACGQRLIYIFHWVAGPLSGIVGIIDMLCNAC